MRLRDAWRAPRLRRTWSDGRRLPGLGIRSPVVRARSKRSRRALKSEAGGSASARACLPPSFVFRLWREARASLSNPRLLATRRRRRAVPRAVDRASRQCEERPRTNSRGAMSATDRGSGAGQFAGRSSRLRRRRLSQRPGHAEGRDEPHRRGSRRGALRRPRRSARDLRRVGRQHHRRRRLVRRRRRPISARSSAIRSARRSSTTSARPASPSRPRRPSTGPRPDAASSM